MTAKIIGTGSCVPREKMTNDELAAYVDTNDEWISTRTGIKERHLAKEETTVSLAVEAAKKALENANTDVSEIQLIIVATCSPDSFFPSTACQVQAAIGAVNAAAFDLSAACSGFLFALNTASAYMSAGIYKKVLIIGAETLSKLLDWSDRSTCVLFGDGAGAAVLEADKQGIIGMVQHSDGAKGGVLTCYARETRNLLVTGTQKTDFLQMDGQEVFRFAVKKVPECIEELLVQTGVLKEEIKYYVLHQANKRIIDSAAKRLKEDTAKFPLNMNLYGNTSAASIPILLDELNRKGMLEKNDKIVLSGFGAGLTWGAALLEWQM